MPAAQSEVEALDQPVPAVGGLARAEKRLRRPVAVPESVPSIWAYRGFALAAADFMVVVTTFLAAYYLRFHVEFMVIKHVAVQQMDLYLGGAFLLACVWVLLVWRDGGYEVGIRGIASPIVRLRSLLMAGVKALALLMVVSYLYRGLLLSRQVYLMAGVMAFGAMTLMRLLFRELDRDLAAQGLALQRVLVVGTDSQTEEFAERLIHSGGTVTLAGFLSTNGLSEGDTFAGHPVVGRIDEIEDVLRRHPFEKLVLGHSTLAPAESGEKSDRLIGLVNFCEAHGISLYTVPNVVNVAVARNEVGTFSGMAVVKLRDAALHRGYAIVKRIMDFTIALAVLLVGLPVWLAIAVLIKAGSRGPVLFTQMRAGLHGRLFRIYKFRSMVSDAEEQLSRLVNVEQLEVPGFKIKGDPRVTPLGKWLRRTGLDEIPQLINVIRGEMSLVGPRPELPELVARYNVWQRRRLKAKPGITGYQQVMARGIPLAAAIEYDLIYLKHQSLLLDLYIMLKTAHVVAVGRGVTH